MANFTERDGVAPDEQSEGLPSDEKAKRIIHRRFDRLEGMMPSWLADYVHGLRKPSARWVRIPAGLLLIAGGVFSILPGLGIWMLPLGLMLLALDFALVRRPTAAMVVGGERKWTQIRRWWRERRDAGT